MAEIMVIATDKLFAHCKSFQGFVFASEFDFEQIILNNFTWMDKPIAEVNFDYKQPIGYAIIYNPRIGKIFAYRRSRADENYKEKRLQGKLSCGVGGHIDKEDAIGDNPIQTSMCREMREEVGIEGIGQMQILGYINDDSEPVGKVHFGVLYLVTITNDVVNPLAPEMSEGELVSIGAFEEKCESGDESVERWTNIAFKAFEKHLAQLV